MKRAVLAVSLVFSSFAYAQDARLQPGLWSVKVLHQTVDGKSYDAQLAAMQEQMRQRLAAMTPEQRQQMEQMMGSMPAADGTLHICISPAMADPTGRCPASKVSRSGNTVTFEFSCTSNGRTSAGTGTSTISANAVDSNIAVTMSDSTASHTMQNQTRMSFLGSDCQGVKPADELAKSAPMSH
jgi:hypothetical protein